MTFGQRARLGGDPRERERELERRGSRVRRELTERRRVRLMLEVRCFLLEPLRRLDQDVDDPEQLLDGIAHEGPTCRLLPRHLGAFREYERRWSSSTSWGARFRAIARAIAITQGFGRRYWAGTRQD